MVDDGVLLQQDGSLLAGWSFRGPYMMSASASEMEALSARLNQVLRLGSGWMLCCDAIRTRAPGYPEEGAFPDLVMQIVDDERREQFMAEGAHFESEYFLTLTHLPARHLLDKHRSKWKAKFVAGRTSYLELKPAR
jgi:type IV secretion system protein VirB4